MVDREGSPTQWVHILQALISRELVEGMGVPARQAASVLGLAPSAVSQYLSGKRVVALDPALAARDDVRRTARAVAEELLRSEPTRRHATRRILEAAAELVEIGDRSGTASRGPVGPTLSAERAMARRLRDRVVAEQAAVADCMRLAQRARDELTRAIFRQVALDSLRHAEIVASLATYLDRGVASTLASGITRRDVERLIAREREAERQAATDLATRLGGVMSLLAGSMEADERKHEELLQGLLEGGFAPSRTHGAARRSARTGSEPRPRSPARGVGATRRTPRSRSTPGTAAR